MTAEAAEAAEAEAMSGMSGDRGQGEVPNGRADRAPWGQG
jgi:hypothetical protein